MKALVYHGPGQKSWDTVADPAPAEPTDIVVRIDTTTICGTDLHILKGDVPAVVDGRSRHRDRGGLGGEHSGGR
jgi:alcohol dehydrogenase